MAMASSSTFSAVPMQNLSVQELVDSLKQHATELKELPNKLVKAEMSEIQWNNSLNVKRCELCNSASLLLDACKKEQAKLILEKSNPKNDLNAVFTKISNLIQIVEQANSEFVEVSRIELAASDLTFQYQNSLSLFLEDIQKPLYIHENPREIVVIKKQPVKAKIGLWPFLLPNNCGSLFNKITEKEIHGFIVSAKQMGNFYKFATESKAIKFDSFKEEEIYIETRTCKSKTDKSKIIGFKKITLKYLVISNEQGEKLTIKLAGQLKTSKQGKKKHERKDKRLNAELALDIEEVYPRKDEGQHVPYIPYYLLCWMELPDPDKTLVWTFSEEFRLISHCNQRSESMATLLWSYALRQTTNSSCQDNDYLSKRVLNSCLIEELRKIWLKDTNAELSEREMEYLSVKISGNTSNLQNQVISDGFVNFEQFLPAPKDKSCVWHYFNSAKESASKELQINAMLKEGLIAGFISEEQAKQNLLSNGLIGSFVIRFSEARPGSISIVYKIDEQHCVKSSKILGDPENSLAVIIVFNNHFRYLYRWNDEGSSNTSKEVFRKYLTGDPKMPGYVELLVTPRFDLLTLSRQHEQQIPATPMASAINVQRACSSTCPQSPPLVPARNVQRACSSTSFQQPVVTSIDGNNSNCFPNSTTIVPFAIDNNANAGTVNFSLGFGSDIFSSTITNVNLSTDDPMDNANAHAAAEIMELEQIFFDIPQNRRFNN